MSEPGKVPDRRQTCTPENPMPKGASGFWQHVGAVAVGECTDGCCDYYQCRDCNARWTNEVPR